MSALEAGASTPSGPPPEPTIPQPGGKKAGKSTGGKKKGRKSGKDFGNLKPGELRPGLFVGDDMKGRYKVEELLNAGSFGAVLGCRDSVKNGDLVAVKMQDRPEERYHRDFEIEIKILQVVCRERPERPDSIVRMLDFFLHQNRWCIVFEALGPSLYEFQRLQNFHPYPLSVVRDITKQVLEALDYIQRLELVHTDLKPENICLVSGEVKRPGTPASSKVRLIDFGTVEFCARHSTHEPQVVSTRQYRAPEVVLGNPWTSAVDIWGLGCVLMEMLTGRQLFPTPQQGDPAHLAMIERVTGPLHSAMVRGAPHDTRAHFNEEGAVRMSAVPEGLQARVERRISLDSMFPDPRDEVLRNLVKDMLHNLPAARISTSAALNHTFFNKAGVDDLLLGEEAPDAGSADIQSRRRSFFGRFGGAGSGSTARDSSKRGSRSPRQRLLRLMTRSATPNNRSTNSSKEKHHQAESSKTERKSEGRKSRFSRLGLLDPTRRLSSGSKQRQQAAAAASSVAAATASPLCAADVEQQARKSGRAARSMSPGAILRKGKSGGPGPTGSRRSSKEGRNAFIEGGRSKGPHPRAADEPKSAEIA